MDPLLGNALSEATVFLSQRGYEWLRTKRELAKNAKTLEEQKEIYEDIINTLIEEENKAKDYALRYKTLYEEVNITDEDIDYLRDTIERIMKILSDIGNSTDNESKINSSDLATMLDLINVDTLKSMQLLGFNYKDAIGKPLTDAASNFLYKSLNTPNPQQHIKN